MAEPKNLDVIMQLIMHGGDAKGNAIEAIEAAKAGDFALANEKLSESEKALVEAHHAQTGLLTQEASGDAVELSLLMVHGQDHLMT
ncbi:MAG: PTS lactose/cellobiose transporter subunit IIA, partial [Trichococcus flocculiformis]